MSDYPNEPMRADYSPPREKSEYKERSASRSPPRRRSSSRDDRRRRSYSRSRSRERRRQSVSPRRRSRSPPRRRSPPRQRSRDHRETHGTRETPEVSNILGVFGLNIRTRDIDLEDVFREFGPIEKVTIVYDHRTKSSRGFGFVYFKDQNDATRARDSMNGADLDGRKIRVDYSVTHRPHTPTPGEYMGERRSGSGYDRGRYSRHSRHHRRDRSRTPPRRRYRSRSRSWSR